MIRFYRDQYDHYTVYDNRKEIGFIHCINYYSVKNRNFRLWTYHIDFGKGESYDDGEDTAAQKIAKSRMCGIMCRAIRAAHDTDENAMEKYLDELENFSCAYTIGVYAMFGKCGTDMPATVADDLAVPFNELHKFKRYIRKIYEMELKRGK